MEKEETMIPLGKDVAQLVGTFAEHVENRALLYDKFSMPKVWGHQEKVNDAGRWSVLRIVTRGSDLLKKDASDRRHQASGRNVRPDNAEKWKREAVLADNLAKIARLDPALVSAATENTRRLLAELSLSFAGQVETFEATLGGRLLINLAGG